MRRSVDLLVRVAPHEAGALAAFREAFEGRFGTRRVPLLEALDPDYGIRIASALDRRPRSRRSRLQRRGRCSPC